MSKFTQGPWVAKGGEVCTEDYEAEGQIMHDHICCCEVVNGESPNANLIAAAPELLEALQEMVAIVKKHTYPQPDKPSSTWGRMEAAEAAIAKALGQ